MDVWFEKVNFILGFLVHKITIENSELLDPELPLQIKIISEKD